MSVWLNVHGSVLTQSQWRFSAVPKKKRTETDFIGLFRVSLHYVLFVCLVVLCCVSLIFFSSLLFVFDLSWFHSLPSIGFFCQLYWCICELSCMVCIGGGAVWVWHYLCLNGDRHLYTMPNLICFNDIWFFIRLYGRGKNTQTHTHTKRNIDILVVFTPWFNAIKMER